MLRLKSLTMLTALAVLVLLTFSTGQVSAQTVPPVNTTVLADHDGDGIPNGQDPDFIKGAGLGRGNGTNFIDENGDGICDLYQGGGQGIGRQSGNRIKSGLRNFVDADGDGVCDNTGNTGMRGAGRGSRVNFVDNDGDGVCDNAGTAASALLNKAGVHKGRGRNR